MQVHHPSWSFNARLGFPVGSGATPCPLLRDASGDNGVFMTPKAVRWLVCGLLVSLGGSDERPGEAAGSCWLLVAHPAPLFLSQLGDISAHGKEVAAHLPPPAGFCPKNSFSFPSLPAERGLLVFREQKPPSL